MNRIIKFQFLYKGIPYGDYNPSFVWHKKAYTLDQLIEKPLSKLSDVHDTCELVAKRQYIGVEDRNEVSVFEGDILDIHQTVNGCNIFVVEWDYIGWVVRYGVEMNASRLYEYCIKSLFAPDRYSGEVEFEVIGNVFENPDLIK